MQVLRPLFSPRSPLFYAMTPFLRIERKKTHPNFVIPLFLPYLCKEIRHGLHGLHGFNGLTPMQTRQTLGRDAKLLKKNPCNPCNPCLKKLSNPFANNIN